MCVCVCVCVVCVGEVSVGVKCEPSRPSDQQEEDVEFDIIPNANDTITVKYTPPAAGTVTIKVLFADQVGSHTRSLTPTHSYSLLLIHSLIHTLIHLLILTLTYSCSLTHTHTHSF